MCCCTCLLHRFAEEVLIDFASAYRTEEFVAHWLRERMKTQGGFIMLVLSFLAECFRFVCLNLQK